MDRKELLEVIAKAKRDEATKLDLSDQGITELPPEIGQLTNLTLLNLSKNQLCSVPAELGQLTNLTSLYLYDNQLCSVPDELRQLTNLKILHLWNNKLSSVPDVLGQLTSLNELYLFDNKLSSIPDVLGQLTSLNELYLFNNHLSSMPAELGQLTNLSVLDLSKNQFSSVPDVLGQLTNLSVLDLSKNQFSSVPDVLGQLTNLTSLSLSKNLLSSLPAELGQLTSLTSLSLSHNHLSSVPVELGQLANLNQLSLSHNQLSSVPTELGQLTNLKTLHLFNNYLSSVPVELGQLTNLSHLDLSNNQLSSIPDELGQLTSLSQLDLSYNQFSSIPDELGQLLNLNEILLSGNPLDDPPPEIVEQGTQAILAYLREQQEEERPVWESKLILVGEGGVGKTQLINSLRGKDFQKHSETTWGIDVVPLELPHPDQQDVMMTLNCWDFGGQEIYHATHQFFLTTRSLFVVAWNARLGWEQGKLHYWLDTIQALAPESPVMLVATHVDERSADLPFDDLKRNYPQIIGEWTVSNSKRDLGDSIETLRKDIRKAAAKLPLMGQPWPKSYWNAAQKIRSLEHAIKHISAGKLQEIMTEAGVSPESHPVLTEQLHQLGYIIFFHKDNELLDTVFLDASWVSKIISKVLVHEEIIEGVGIFCREHMEEVWPKLDSAMRERFLRLMEKFDLSYRIPEDPENKSLVVERLAQDSPEYECVWDGLGGQDGFKEICMKFDPQSTRPAGIPTWFIARSHRFTTNTHWRYGALFQDKQKRHLALVEAPPSEDYVRLRVRGPNPYNFFTILRDGLDLTFDRFSGLKLKRTIPCPLPKQGEPDLKCSHSFDLAQLERRMQQDPPKLEIECPECMENVSVSQLLFGIHWTTNSAVLNRLDELDSAADERHQEMLGEVEDLRELSQRQFLTLYNAEQRLAESHCPRVFSLRPTSQSQLWSSKWELQLYCEAPGCWHPACGGQRQGHYEMKQPAKWLNTIAPWVKHMINVFRFGAHLAGPVMGYAAEGLNELIKNDIKLMKAIVDEFPEIEKHEELIAKHGFKESESASIMGDGASLRSLRKFLLTLDPEEEWGDLRKTLTPEGHWLWLCDEHAEVYRR